MASSTSTPGTVNLQHSLVKDLADVFDPLYGAELQTISDPRGGAVPVLVVPRGKEIRSVKALLEEYRGAPERRSGTATLLDLDSFIRHVQRFSDRDSCLFADPNPASPSVTAVFDYNQGLEGREDPRTAQPRFGKHRAVYPCPLSDEWKVWQAADGQSLAQADFAQFLEDRIGDVAAVGGEDAAKLEELAEAIGGRLGGPQSLHTLSRGLLVNVSSVVKQAVTLESGEISLIYEEQHRDGAGDPIKTPNLFVLQIPIFFNGPLYRIPVRLRYRVQGGRVAWSFHLYRADASFRHAFDEITSTAADETGLQLYVGSPER